MMDAFLKDVKTLLGITLSSRQIQAFQRYEDELLDWNSRFNLTAIRERGGIRSRHFLDSLTCILAWGEKHPASLIDIGTGAGFPGIPLKILYPNLRLTLVESVGKKAGFCMHIVEMFGFEKVDVLQARAEDLGQSAAHREQYEWAVARAVADLPILVEYLLPLVRVGGAVLAQKGTSGPVEAQNAARAIRMLGGHLRQIIPVMLPGVSDDRWLVVIEKKVATPPSYPRRAGLPARKPL